jgi:hypothetical protein
MNRRPRHARAWIALAAVALVCAIAAATAGAARVVATTATLTFNAPDNFSGQVSTPSFKKCQIARLVTLFFTGVGGNNTPEFVEAAKTDSSGHYEINAVGGARAGNYNIVVAKRVIRKHGKVTKCRAFTSPQFTF